MLKKSLLALSLGAALCSTSMASNNDNNVEGDAAPRVQVANPFNYSASIFPCLQMHRDNNAQKLGPDGKYVSMDLSEAFKTVHRMIFDQQFDTNTQVAIGLVNTLNFDELNLLRGALTLFSGLQKAEFGIKATAYKKTDSELKAGHVDLEDWLSAGCPFSSEPHDVWKAKRAELLKEHKADIILFKRHVLVTQKLFHFVQQKMAKML